MESLFPLLLELEDLNDKPTPRPTASAIITITITRHITTQIATDTRFFLFDLTTGVATR
jgi:hypothetical protein